MANCWCSRPGWCATCASTRTCSTTASTSTSAFASRGAGRKLLVADLLVRHHRSLELIADLELWTEAHIRMAEKWDGALAPSADDEQAWKERARFAEARREAARACAFSENLRLDARVLELERALEEKTDSLSWRMTAPLRALNRWRKGAAERRWVP